VVAEERGAVVKLRCQKSATFLTYHRHGRACPGHPDPRGAALNLIRGRWHKAEDDASGAARASWASLSGREFFLTDDADRFLQGVDALDEPGKFLGCDDVVA
jgi:hypothetical protein